MAKQSLEKLTDEELVEKQIDISNQRAEATDKFKADGLEIQEELDRRELDKRIGQLTPSQADYLREKLAAEAKEEKSDG